MPLDEEARGKTAGRDADPDDAVLRLSLDDHSAEHVQPERRPGVAIFAVARHRRGDLRIDPVTCSLIVVVGTAAGKNERAKLDDPGERLHRRLGTGARSRSTATPCSAAGDPSTATTIGLSTHARITPRAKSRSRRRLADPEMRADESRRRRYGAHQVG
jgi:hypothetical protein